MIDLTDIVPSKYKSEVKGTPHYVYIIKIEVNGMELYKIGYSQDVEKRIKSISSVEKPSSEVKGKGVKVDKITLLAKARFSCKDAAVSYEKYLHSKFKEFNYKGNPVLANGNSELFRVNVLNMLASEQK